MEKTLIRRKPNPFTFNGESTVVLDRWRGTIFELEGELAALYQILGDEYTSVEDLSSLYERSYGRPLSPEWLEQLRRQDGLIDVRVK